MKTKLNCTFLLITMLGLVSCASTRGFPERVEDVENELTVLRTYFQKEMLTEYDLENSRPETQKRTRNKIINGRIAGIDVEFSQFQQGLHEQGMGLNVGTDAIMLGLGAAGALASGGASQVLSATSAAVIGLKGSIDKNAFYEQAMPALFAKMIAKRKAVLVNIRRGLGAPTSLYPLQQGIADLEEYRYAGTIPGAISAVIETAGAESTNSDATLSTIMSNTYYGIEHSEDTIYLENWLEPNGVQDDKRWNNAQTWLNQNFKGQDVTTVMSVKGVSKERKQLIDAIKKGDLK